MDTDRGASEGQTKIEDEIASVKPYGLADATGLFSQQTSIMNGLWAVYGAVTFAIAGFGISSPTMTWGTALVVTIGFWVFTLSHLALIRQTLTILGAVRGEIDEILTNKPSFRFHRTLRSVVQANNPLWISTVVHLMIDLCATGALLSRLRWA